MAKTEPSLLSGRNCWRIERADRATVIVDAEDYFRFARLGMLGAQQQLLLIGWDFDARIRLVDQGSDNAPAKVGPLIDWIVQRHRSLEVLILRWDTGALKSLFRGKTALTLLRWSREARVKFKLDRHHPVAAAHHQKIVVIDDCLAFCGGIDMTDDRWDTQKHQDKDQRRLNASGKPYGPWHDATTALSGPVAAALGELCRKRWECAGGGMLPVPNASDACWPDDLGVDFENCEVAISRTMPAMPDSDPVFEIEMLYVDLIARAERWIYAESQYFASHKVAATIASRLEEPDGPEIVIVNPVKAQGWLEPIAMDTARARLFEELKRRDRHGRLRIYHPFTRAGEPIYVHAKVTIIDGQILRVGSSNFNNRSMRLDSECDVTIDATMPANRHAADGVRSIAVKLLAEHLGKEETAIAAHLDRTGSLIETIEANQSSNGRRLVAYRPPELNAVEGAIADSHLLDPKHPEKMMEALTSSSVRQKMRDVKPGTAIIAGAIGTTAVGTMVALAWRRRNSCANQDDDR